ncbi:MAG TPA: GNAT family N-acetyltransferase [Opitutaceae bacterium]|nr:GNAT family N-acetyltransferase [Opitutaceae bacterium]
MSVPSAQPLRFRPATIEDAAAIAVLATTVWIDTYCDAGIPRSFAEYVLREFTVAKTTELLASPANRLWLAEAEEGIVGFAHLRLHAPTEHLDAAQPAEVSRLYVLERFARRGIGRSLLERCRTSAAEEEANALWLTVYSGNPRARAFYQRLGWRKIGDTTFVLDGQAYANEVFALEW